MTAARREEISVPGQPAPFSHYTEAVRADDLLFVSGVVPIDAAGRLVGGDDATEQARQVFRNMAAILAVAGATIADVVKVTVFLTRIEDREAVDVARREAFGAVRPASTLVEISRLVVPGARVEIEAVALLGR